MQQQEETYTVFTERNAARRVMLAAAIVWRYCYGPVRMSV